MVLLSLYKYPTQAVKRKANNGKCDGSHGIKKQTDTHTCLCLPIAHAEAHAHVACLLGHLPPHHLCTTTTTSSYLVLLPK